jgi:acyl-coenzyme A thioesterase PaaI-like protein
VFQKAVAVDLDPFDPVNPLIRFEPRRTSTPTTPGACHVDIDRGATAMQPLQDLYPDDFAHCYGCGRLNTHGLHVKSEWLGDEAIARFQPAPHHIALPGFVYGGLIASLMDCHAMATAAAASMTAAGASPGVDPTPRFVTASLQVDFLRPTPLGPELLLRAHPTNVGERKVTVDVTLLAGDIECAKGRVIAVRRPATMGPG